MSIEEAAAVMSHEAQQGHDTGKGSYAAKVRTVPTRDTYAGRLAALTHPCIPLGNRFLPGAPAVHSELI